MEVRINQDLQKMHVSFRMVYVPADTPRISYVDGPNARILPNNISSVANAGGKMIMANAKA